MGTRYLGRKVFQALLTIGFVLIVNFLLFRAMPGSAERILLRNPHISQAQLEAQRERWGLNKPIFPDQVVDYVVATLEGDLATASSSAASRSPRSSARRSGRPSC